MKNSNNHNDIYHVTTGNVLDDLGLSPPDVALLKLKVDLHVEILKIIRRRNYTSKQLQKIFDVPQPRISELLRGKLSSMSVDKLAEYLFLLGRRVRFVTASRTLRADERKKLAA